MLSFPQSTRPVIFSTLSEYLIALISIHIVSESGNTNQNWTFSLFFFFSSLSRPFFGNQRKWFQYTLISTVTMLLQKLLPHCRYSPCSLPWFSCSIGLDSSLRARKPFFVRLDQLNVHEYIAVSFIIPIIVQGVVFHLWTIIANEPTWQSCSATTLIFHWATNYALFLAIISK